MNAYTAWNGNVWKTIEDQAPEQFRGQFEELIIPCAEYDKVVLSRETSHWQTKDMEDVMGNVNF